MKKTIVNNNVKQLDALGFAIFFLIGVIGLVVAIQCTRLLTSEWQAITESQQLQQHKDTQP